MTPTIGQARDLLGPERLTEVYAGTESNGLTIIRGDEWLARPASVGRPPNGTEVRVVDPEVVPVPAGTTGRVQLRRAAGAAYRCVGADTPAPGAWDTLGDDGRLDEDGRLYLADRGGDRSTRAGTSVYPAEIERVLESHPLVRSAVAVGVPGDDVGQRIHAVADVDAAQVDGEDLRAWVDARLDPERRVDSLTVVHEPVRDDAGKVRRRDRAPSGVRAAGEERDQAASEGPRSAGEAQARAGGGPQEDGGPAGK